MIQRCASLIFLIPILASAAPKPAETVGDSSSGAGAEVSATPSRSERGTLSAGDTVSFQIVEDKEAAIEKRISDTGDLDVPYIGRVHVAGKTCADAAAMIKKQLEQDYYHHATVRLAINQFRQSTSTGLATIAMARINVAGDQGALRTPGQQEFPKTEKLTVSAAVMRAGPTIYANQRAVKVTRRKGDATETVVVNVERILKEGKLNEDFEVHDGDYIFVPKRPIVY